jgi:hypothetical protein
MSKYLTSDVIFTTGPFAENSQLVNDFGTSMYFSYLFEDSMKKHIELEKEYEKALLQHDKELAELRRSELETMEGIYKVSFSIFKAFEKVS